MTKISEMQCVPCKGDTPALTQAEIERYLPEVPGWEVVTGVGNEDGVQQLKRVFKFKNFAQALAFTNKVGAAAEEEDHHPTLLTEWGRVTVRWWTHTAMGLHTNDFVMAHRTSALYEE